MKKVSSKREQKQGAKQEGVERERVAERFFDLSALPVGIGTGRGLLSRR